MTEHRRDKTTGLNILETEVIELLSSPSENEWRLFLTTIREQKPRYYRDHLTLLKKLMKDYSSDTLEDAMIYCSINELYSVNDLKSAAEYMSQYEQDIKVDKPEIQLLNNKGIINLNTQKRKITEYEFLGDDDNE